jgi:hypothetical protein
VGSIESWAGQSLQGCPGAYWLSHGALVDVDVVVLRNITSKPHGSNENNNKTEVTPMIYGSVSYI